MEVGGNMGAPTKHKVIIDITIHDQTIKAGEIVDALRVTDEYYKVFHAIGWLKVPECYLEVVED